MADSSIQLILIIGFLTHLTYWIYLLSTKRSERKTSRWRWGSLLIFLIAIAILQLLSPAIGRLRLLDTSLLKSFGLVLFLLGTALSLWAKKTLGKNWNTGWEYQVKKNHQLVTTGPFKVIRHPIYTGILLVALGFELALANSLFFLVAFIFAPALYLQALKEESLLIKRFGESYRHYQKRTKMFIPFYNLTGRKLKRPIPPPK